MSYVTPESRELVELDATAHRIREDSGAILLGPDSGAWPAVWVDAVGVFAIQRILHHNARKLAEIEELERRRQRNGR